MKSSSRIETTSTARTSRTAYVVGMKYYGVSATEVSGLICKGARLIREPTNAHDRNAIAVVAGSKTLGHIDRESAAILAPRIDMGANWSLTLSASKSATAASVPVTIVLEQTVEKLTYPKVCSPQTIGIYAIKVDGAMDHSLGHQFSHRTVKAYVGQSLDIQDRLKQHWWDLSRGVHSNPELQRLWDELGPAKFECEVLEIAPQLNVKLDLVRWL